TGIPAARAAPLTSSTRRSIVSGLVGQSSRTCGVAASFSMPSSAAARRMSRLPSRSSAPSSIPGRTCEWRSITTQRRALRGLDVLLRDGARVREALFEQREARLEVGLLVLRGVVLRVLGDVAELASDADPLRDFPAAIVREVLNLVLELLEALGRENDFLHPAPLQIEPPAEEPPSAGSDGTPAPRGRQQGPGT